MSQDVYQAVAVGQRCAPTVQGVEGRADRGFGHLGCGSWIQPQRLARKSDPSNRRFGAAGDTESDRGYELVHVGMQQRLGNAMQWLALCRHGVLGVGVNATVDGIAARKQSMHVCSDACACSHSAV